MERKVFGNDEDKTLTLVAILEVLERETDSEHPMTKQKLRERVEKHHRIPMARNTLDAKFNALAEVFPIEHCADGWYLEREGLTDGELRILIDSVLSSDLVNHRQSGEMIEKLIDLGSISFRKNTGNLKHRTGNVKKTKRSDTVFIVEELQSAIFRRKQISCNYEKYGDDLKLHRVYAHDRILNPYELVCSGGRHYLLCAQDGSETLAVLRIDRMVDVRVLESPCHRIAAMEALEKESGVAEYISKQPVLAGGVQEKFTLQCAKTAIDEVLDTFGNGLRVRHIENDDPDTVIFSVETSREAIKGWAVMHADKVVILEPEDVREEISEALHIARHRYFKTGKTAHVRRMIALDFAEAVRESQISGGRILHYVNHAKEGQDVLDMSVLRGMTDLRFISIRNCVLMNMEVLEDLPNLTSLNLNGCIFDIDVLKWCPQLNRLVLTAWDEAAAGYIAAMNDLRDLTFCECPVEHLDFLEHCANLKEVQLFACPNLKDISALGNLRRLRRVNVRDCGALTDYSCLDDLPECKLILK